MTLHLFSFFHENGFSWLPGEQQFRRQTAFGFQNIIYAMGAPDEDNKRRMLCTFGSHIARVEKIIAPFVAEFQGTKVARNTTITSLAKLLNLPHQYYEIGPDLRVPERDLIDDAEEMIIPFLNYQNDLQLLEKLYNATPLKASQYAFNEKHRCFRGLALAVMTHRPDITQLAKAYEDYMKIQVAPEFTRSAFKAFSRYVNQLALQQN